MLHEASMTLPPMLDEKNWFMKRVGKGNPSRGFSESSFPFRRGLAVSVILHDCADMPRDPYPAEVRVQRARQNGQD